MIAITRTTHTTVGLVTPETALTEEMEEIQVVVMDLEAFVETKGEGEEGVIMFMRTTRLTHSSTFSNT